MPGAGYVGYLIHLKGRGGAETSVNDRGTEKSGFRHRGIVRRIWRGDLPLHIVFWNWAVIGGVIVNLITSFLFLFLLNSDQVIAAVAGGYLLSLPYNFIVCVGVWRSSERYEGDRHWAEMAKYVTLIGMLLLSFT